MSSLNDDATLKVLRRPVMTFCDVCQAKFESDLAWHGPGSAAISLGCGHLIVYENNVTSYYKDAKLELRKEESGHQLPLL